MRKIYILFLISAIACTCFDANAYDMATENTNGNTIYYNRIADNQVEVTYEHRFQPTQSYAGHLSVPGTIEVDDVIYEVTGVGDNAFFNCRELLSVQLPATVSSIGMRAFAWCDAITEIELPKAVDHIGANVFDGCYSLSSITAAKGSAAFNDVSGVLYSADMSSLVAYTPGVFDAYVVAEGTTEIGDNAFGACTFLTSVSLPDGLTRIGDNAFYFCNMLDGVNVPASVSHIGKAAFADCMSLDHIDVEAGNVVYTSVDGVLYDKQMHHLIQSPGAFIGALTMPDGVTHIDETAFFRNYNLSTLQLPQSVKSIGEAAFIDCPRLASVEIPSSVSSIGAMAFAMCPSLSGIYVACADPDDISLGDHVFVDVDKNQCTLYVPEASISTYSQAPQWSEFKNIRPSDRLKQQTIIWDTDCDTILLGSTILLNAEASSDLPVSYLMSTKSVGLADIDGDKLVLHTLGKVSVTAYQAGNHEYLPAVPVTHTFDVRLTGIDDLSADSVRVYATYGAIVVDGVDAETPVSVFDIKGSTIYNGKNHRIPVMPGCVYVVRVGMRSYKVAVPR